MMRTLRSGGLFLLLRSADEETLGGKLRASDPLTLRRCGKRMTEDAPDAAAVAAVGDCTRGGGNDGESGWREGTLSPKAHLSPKTNHKLRQQNFNIFMHPFL